MIWLLLTIVRVFKIQKDNVVLLKLAKAYELNKNYQESIDTYNAIDKQKLSNYAIN